MKIVHVITSLKMGGAEAVLSRLLTHTKHHHIHHVLYFYDGPHVALLRHQGIAVTQIRGIVSPYDLVGMWRLYKAICVQKPDLVHSSLWSATVLASLYSYLLGIPIVCDVHNMLEHNGRVRNAIMRSISWIPARYIAVGTTVKDSFVRWWTRHHDSSKQGTTTFQPPVTVINNGIDAANMQQRGFKRPMQRSEFGWSKRDFIIGSVGRLEPEKSYEVLIEAARYLREQKYSCKVCIIGEGSARRQLEEYIKRHGLAAHVQLLGARDAASFYPLFDCYVSSSKTEGLSIALLEALCFGLPVVLTHGQQTHDVIEHGVNGYVVPVGNASLIAQHVMMLRDHSDVARHMSMRNKTLVKEKFSLTTMAQAYDEVYHDVLAHRQQL